MIQANALIRTDAGDESSESQLSKATAQPAQEHPVAIALRLLRGRYHWAIILGVILGAVGGIGGYLAKVPPYQSVGTIQIRAVVPKILYPTDQNNVMPMFESFIQSQVAIIQSQRVLEMARQSPDWQAVRPNATTAALAKALMVDHRPNTELIYVGFTDPDPKVAVAGAKSFIGAYQNIFKEYDAKSDAERSQVLEDLRTALSNQLKGLNSQVSAIATEYGTDNLESLYKFKESELARQESQMRQLQVEISMFDTGPKTDASTQPAEPTLELIAQRDPIMSEYLRLQTVQETDLTGLLNYCGDNHPKVRAARMALESTRASIAQQKEKYMRDRTSAVPTQTGTSDDPTLLLAQLQQRGKNAKAIYEQLKTETLDLGRKQLQLKTLKDQIDTVQHNLQEVKGRMEQLNVESSSISGRISIISTGDQPAAPVSDKRKTLAGLGGFGGLALGFGLAMLRGYTDKRIKDLADAEYTFKYSTKFLGFLPVLPEDTSDPMQVSLAAHCVHHVRMLLQLNPHLPARPVWSVTSATAGDGKTSLSMALGMSFAASGLKTLLIDCDLIGGGLTARMNPVVRHRKIGQILLQEGLLSEEHIAAALNRAKTSGRKIGEELVNAGVLTSADLDHALRVQRAASMGLQDMLGGESLTECVTSTGIPNLFILPLGQSDTQYADHISPRTVRRLVDEAREHFETIIIDTGPILGSLDAAMIAAQVDEVILAVPRNQSRTLADQAISQLKTIGSRLAGAIFNRVLPDDITSSHSSSSIGIRSAPPVHTNGAKNTHSSNGSANGSANGPTNGSNGSTRLGPLGRAVTSSTINNL
ncbi:MAG: AAA family ATPase [Phycisphaerales bacterium]|nr:AAA family ATPase [Phycisphaerales bacterium]